jgi:hypothetical protein
MADLVFVAAIVGFFALSVGLVHVCARIIGPDLVAVEATGAPDARETVEEAA